jgi:hypothetical protein
MVGHMGRGKAVSLHGRVRDPSNPDAPGPGGHASALPLRNTRPPNRPSQMHCCGEQASTRHSIRRAVAVPPRCMASFEKRKRTDPHPVSLISVVLLLIGNVAQGTTISQDLLEAGRRSACTGDSRTDRTTILHLVSFCDCKMHLRCVFGVGLSVNMWI